MRQIISKNRVLLILSVAFAAFLLPFYGYAEEEGELLYPRAGDKLQKIELDVKTVSINDDKSIDLSSAKPIGDLKVEFFDCSKRNFGSDLAVVYNNQSSLHLRKTTGGFYVKREYKPGQFIDYDVCYPYLATGKNNYNGKGAYGLFMDVSVSGASTASWVSNNAKIVCADNDTLTECKVLALERMETRIVECGDSIEEVLHKGMVTKWFKQGFRYPIVELVEDALITQDSLTLVDKSVRCFYFPIESQVVQVTEDPDNEELRNNYIQYSKNEKGILYKGIEAGKLQLQKSVLFVFLIKKFSECHRSSLFPGHPVFHHSSNILPCRRILLSVPLQNFCRVLCLKHIKILAHQILLLQIVKH